MNVGPPLALALDVMLAADFAICVTVPEPPAIEATYRFVRPPTAGACGARSSRIAFALARRSRHQGDRQAPAPLELIRGSRRSIATSPSSPGPSAAHASLPRRNQTRVRTDMELATSMSALCRRHYGISLDELAGSRTTTRCGSRCAAASRCSSTAPRPRQRATSSASPGAWPRSPPQNRTIVSSRRPRPRRPDHYTVLGIVAARTTRDPPRLQATARGLRDRWARDDVAARRSRALGSAGAHRRGARHAPRSGAPASLRLSMFAEEDAPAQSAPCRGRRSPRAAHAPGRARARDRPRQPSSPGAAPQGARVAGHRAHRDQLAHEDSRSHLVALEEEVYADLPRSCTYEAS